MKWKKRIKLGIIIYTFFLSSIECKTTVIATEFLKSNLESQMTTKNFKQIGSLNHGELFENLFIKNKEGKRIKLFLGDIYTGEVMRVEYVMEKQLEETDELFLTKALKFNLEQSDAYIGGIPNDGVIKHIEVNLLMDSVTIDMTKEYDLKYYGSTAEYLILQSLATTVAHYYSVHTVAIKIEGEPYCSGHFCFRENQSIEIFKYNSLP